MISVKSLDLNNFNVNKKLFRNILIDFIGYVMVKTIRFIKINSINPLYLIIDKINWYIEKSNGNKYLTLVRTDESKGTLESMNNMESN